MDERQVIKAAKNYVKYYYPDLNIDILPFELTIQEGWVVNLITEDGMDLPFIPAKFIRMLDNGTAAKDLEVCYLTEDKLGYVFPIIEMNEKKDYWKVTYQNNSNFVKRIENKEIKEITDNSIKTNNYNEYVMYG